MRNSSNLLAHYDRENQKEQLEDSALDIEKTKRNQK